MVRDTTTGRVLEEIVLPSLERGGYFVQRQINIGTRLGGGKHIADTMAIKEGRQILISLKWQQSSGTAEQKVPFEYMCLSHALSENPEFDAAYIVIGGTGWTKDRFFKEELSEWVATSYPVTVIGLEDFIARSYDGKI